MPRCHQCSADTGTDGRNGDCKVCYSKGVDLCQRCAMWELGPLPANIKLASKLRRKKKAASTQRQDRDKPKSALAKIGDEPLACDVFLPTMGRVCPFFKDQLKNADATLYGKPFKEYCCDVLDKFRDLYKTCKYDRLALQILIAMHLSSQERVQCRTGKDKKGESSSDHAKPVKRWQTRTIARAHLENHLDQVKRRFGKTVRDTVARPAWLLALGCDDLELFMKGFKHPTLMAIDLLAAAGGADAAREALEVFLIVYHALTATRSRGDVTAHWSVKASSFIPREALGFVSKEHFESLYGDVDEAKAFDDTMKARIESLWNVLGDADAKNALPAHPRYPDLAISGHTALDDAEKSYLQYLPTFDHPHAQRASRTACEKAVRTRVLATLKNYLGDYAPAEWLRPPDLALQWTRVPATKGRVKQLTLREPRRGTIPSVDIVFGKDGIHASKKLDPVEKAKITPFLKSLLTTNSDLRNHGCRVEIEISGEEGNDRRAARRKAVEDAVKEAFETEKWALRWRPAYVDTTGALEDDAPLDDFLDDLCVKMRADFCVDQAFDCGVSKMILQNALTGGTFTPKAWFPLKTRDVPFTQLFPDCAFDAIDLATIEDHYEEVEGSSPRPAHYMDWRNHKDHWLYDCFPIERRRRPIFASLSVQPYLPGPNPNYGGHILFYDRPATVDRAVYTFGDKQQPRRSMLLVLDTILHGRKKKDGDAAQKKKDRQMVIYQLLRRYDVITFYAGWSAEQLWQRTLEAPKVPYPGGDLLIECQIFGGVTLTDDAWGFVPACEDKKSDYYIAKDHLTTQALTAGLGQLGNVYPDITVLPYSPSAGAGLENAKSGKSDWEAHLTEIAE